MTNIQDENGMVRMELKYCEHCGGLWVREGGAGVYCQKCIPKVAELPVPKKKPGRVRLPSGPRSVVEEYGDALPNDRPEIEAMGGVA